MTISESGKKSKELVEQYLNKAKTARESTNSLLSSFEQIKKTAESAAKSASDTASSAASTASNATSSVASTATSAVSTASDTASNATSSVASTAASTASDTASSATSSAASTATNSVSNASATDTLSATSNNSINSFLKKSSTNKLSNMESLTDKQSSLKSLVNSTENSTTKLTRDENTTSSSVNLFLKKNTTTNISNSSVSSSSSSVSSSDSKELNNITPSKENNYEGIKFEDVLDTNCKRPENLSSNISDLQQTAQLKMDYKDMERDYFIKNPDAEFDDKMDFKQSYNFMAKNLGKSTLEENQKTIKQESVKEDKLTKVGDLKEFYASDKFKTLSTNYFDKSKENFLSK